MANPGHALAEWLDIRSHETRAFVLSFMGAFLVLGYLVLARSLREAFYLVNFDIETLPFITATLAVLSVPTVLLFARVAAHYDTRMLLRWIALIQVVGLGVLWPLLELSGIAVVAFYLWTALGTLVLTSGFWIMTSELFPLRSAKRLFGLISAGGTTGAMLIGTSLNGLTTLIGVIWLVPLLLILLCLFVLVQFLLPPAEGEQQPPAGEEDKSSWHEGLLAVWENSHLRTIGLIVLTATMATTLLDYQFKEMVRHRLDTEAALAGFLGAFYGWTGAVSLLVQLFIGARLLKTFGIGWVLSILPLIVLGGSIGFLLIPTIVVITLARGADNSLRRSLHRAALEVLFVPINSRLRRKTKTFIDSVLDSLAEGLGALVIFLWVTWAHFSSLYLSIFVIGFTGCFLALNRTMQRQYFETVVERLEEGGAMAKPDNSERVVDHDLLTASMAMVDLTDEMDALTVKGEVESRTMEPSSTPSRTPLERIQSSNTAIVLKTLQEFEHWDGEHIPALMRLLTRDACYHAVVPILADQGERALPLLVETLQDERRDFVVRRRIPLILSLITQETAAEALLEALSTKRFEIRYRAAIALMHRREYGLAFPDWDWKASVWKAIRYEVNRGRAVWEMQRLLDHFEADPQDDFIRDRVGLRGELSLEHTFRMLALVRNPQPVRMAFHGILGDDEKLKSFALEYLEQVLPDDIRRKLWPFIGDISAYQRAKSARPLDAVISDLVTTGATLFPSDADKAELKKALDSKTP